jgi:hypothetical protein
LLNGKGAFYLHLGRPRCGLTFCFHAAQNQSTNFSRPRQPPILIFDAEKLCRRSSQRIDFVAVAFMDAPLPGPAKEDYFPTALAWIRSLMACPVLKAST